MKITEKNKTLTERGRAKAKSRKIREPLEEDSANQKTGSNESGWQNGMGPHVPMTVAIECAWR